MCVHDCNILHTHKLLKQRLSLSGWIPLLTKAQPRAFWENGFSHISHGNIINTHNTWCLFVRSLLHNVQVSKNIFNAVFILREGLQMLVFKRLEGWTLTTLFKLSVHHTLTSTQELHSSHLHRCVWYVDCFSTAGASRLYKEDLVLLLLLKTGITESPVAGVKCDLSIICQLHLIQSLLLMTLIIGIQVI